MAGGLGVIVRVGSESTRNCLKWIADLGASNSDVDVVYPAILGSIKRSQGILQIWKRGSNGFHLFAGFNSLYCFKKEIYEMAKYWEQQGRPKC